jgi:plasmid stability protein
MTTRTIRELDPSVEQRRRDRAARHGNSTGEEVTHMLQNFVGSTNNKPKSTCQAMDHDFRDLKGAEVDLPTGRSAPTIRSVATD